MNLRFRQFGRWTVIGESNRTKRDSRYVLCRCECGTVRPVQRGSLLCGDSTSCGCYRKEFNTTHGHNRKGKTTRTYWSWYHMKERCTNSNHQQYRDYGGRGIQVCDRWQDFENFLTDMGERPENTSLDRIDGNGHYDPTNCRWATKIEQANNTRDNRRLVYGGISMTIAQAARRFDMPYQTLWARHRAGWLSSRIIETPVRGIRS